jgi:hypothetical protein
LVPDDYAIYSGDAVATVACSFAEEAPMVALPTRSAAALQQSFVANLRGLFTRPRPSVTEQFVIGIGAQRAGTTTLHQILERCTPVFMHPYKELHYFDTVHGIRDAAASRTFATSLLGKGCHAPPFGEQRYAADDPRAWTFVRTCTLLSRAAVHEIDYRDLFLPGGTGCGLFGEITPEYMLLDKKGVEGMRRVVGGDARLILMVRNPVQRLISGFKLLMHNRVDGRQPVNPGALLTHHLETHSRFIQRQDAYNDYVRSIQLFDALFPGRLLVLRYDSLFDDREGLRLRLEQFLGEPVDAEEFSRVTDVRYNSLGESASIPPEVLQRLEARYRDQIAFINERCGRECVR